MEINVVLISAQKKRPVLGTKITTSNTACIMQVTMTQQTADLESDPPLFARSMAVSFPMPLLAPVISTVFSSSLSAEDQAARKKFLEC